MCVFLEDKWASEIKAKISLSMGCMFGERDNTKWVFLALIKCNSLLLKAKQSSVKEDVYFCSFPWAAS